MNQICYSSPGKVILFGEHAVVYGNKAVSTAISLRIYAKIIEKQNNQQHPLIINLNSSIIEIEIVDLLHIQVYNQILYQDLEQKYPQKEKAIFLYLIKILLDEYTKEIQDKIIQQLIKQKNQYVMTIHSEIPIAKGLGSSASFSACSTTTLMHWMSSLANIPFLQNNKLIYQIVQQIEAIFHGTPSGIDANTVIYGQTINIQNPFFDEIEIWVIDSGLPKSTKQAVSNVRKLKEQKPLIIESIMNTINLISEDCKNIQNYEQLKFLVKTNQKCLEQLDINNDELDKIVQWFDQRGIGCKITGGGLGGCCIAFVRKENVPIQIPWNYYKVKINCDGLRQEKDSSKL